MREKVLDFILILAVIILFAFAIGKIFQHNTKSFNFSVTREGFKLESEYYNDGANE